MNLDYPHDYHPLAPILRQLRHSLSWLDQSGVQLSQAQLAPLLSRLAQLPKQRLPKDQRPLQLAQYWNQLPYHSQLDPQVHSQLNSVHTQVKDTQTKPQVSPNTQKTDLSPEGQSGPLPARLFPAVSHQRAVVESISFEQAPPQGTEMEGSAELMKYSASLKLHRGLDRPNIKQESGKEQGTQTQVSAQQESSFFDKPILQEQQVQDFNSHLTPTSKTGRSQQLWATQPQAEVQPLPTNSEPSVELSQKKEAFAKLQLNKRSIPTKTTQVSQTETSLNTLNRVQGELGELTQPGSPLLPHLLRTGFETDQLVGEICDRIWSCQSCTRSTCQSVIGNGHHGAQIMFVVAHASKTDLATGHLLMNKQERELFNGLLRAMSLSRLEIYLTSLMKCGSETPQPHEWSECQNHFIDELQVVRPQVIVCLGYVASVMLLGNYARQGVWSRYQEIDVMPTFHPSDIIIGGDTTKRTFWNHLKLVMRKAGLQNPSRPTT